MRVDWCVIWASWLGLAAKGGAPCETSSPRLRGQADPDNQWTAESRASCLPAAFKVQQGPASQAFAS